MKFVLYIYIYIYIYLLLFVYLCICVSSIMFNAASLKNDGYLFRFIFKQIPHFVEGIILPGLFHCYCFESLYPTSRIKNNLIIIIYHQTRFLFFLNEHQTIHTLIYHIEYILQISFVIEQNLTWIQLYLE